MRTNGGKNANQPPPAAQAPRGAATSNPRQPPGGQSDSQPQPPEIAASLSEIDNLLAEAASLRADVERFPGGSKSDKDYRYLDEKLTRLLLSLDNVDAFGSDEVRGRRRVGVLMIQDIIHQLERKAT